MRLARFHLPARGYQMPALDAPELPPLRQVGLGSSCVESARPRQWSVWRHERNLAATLDSTSGAARSTRLCRTAKLCPRGALRLRMSAYSVGLCQVGRRERFCSLDLHSRRRREARRTDRGAYVIAAPAFYQTPDATLMAIRPPGRWPGLSAQVRSWHPIR